MPKELVVKSNQNRDEPLFNTWSNEAEKKKAIAAMYGSLDENILYKTSGSQTFKDVLTNISISEPFARSDYEKYRVSESIPTNSRTIKIACTNAYKKIGIVKNIIDLMTDFTVQGIRLEHPNKRIKKFHEEWATKVKFEDRSERFANLLYKQGTVVCKRAKVKLNASKIENLYKGMASADLEYQELEKIAKNEIPWQYTFLNPTTLETVDEELAMFVGEPIYQLRLNHKLASIVNSPKTEQERKLVNMIPEDIRRALSSSSKILILDPNKISVFHYKKDDWEVWGDPITYAALPHLILYEKMQLADLSALDGAISHIRVWKLGNLQEKIVPNKAAFSRLADILINRGNAGSIDLLWGPDIELIETSTNVHQFLGEQKYIPVLNAIFGSFGIPQTLTGSSKGGGSFTNNFVSIKTLIERLKYGRRILKEFWQKELKLLQMAMGFRFPAEVTFDTLTMSDEAAEKALLIQLADRDIISFESIKERFGFIPELQDVKIRQEYRQRESGLMPEKMDGFHQDGNKPHDLNKIALQTGVVTPSQIGMELEPVKDGEKSALEMNIELKKQQQKEKKQAGQPQQGRPRNSKDSKKRKRRRVLPRSKAAIYNNCVLWAQEAQQKIADIINPLYLLSKNKKNMRMLTDIEYSNIEKFKFVLLYNMQPFQDIDSSIIEDLVSKVVNNLIIENMRSECVIKFKEKFNKDPVIEDIRKIEAMVYALYQDQLYQDENLE